jgi:O-antigen/teichoic acid export membrane protein
MSMAGLFMAMVGLLNAVIAAAGKIWQGCAITFSWAIAFFVTSSLVIPRWGAVGAAAVFAFSYIIYLLLLCCHLHFILRVRLNTMRRLAIATIGSCLMAIVLVYTYHGVALYVAALLLLAGITIGIFFWVCDETERKAGEFGLIRFKQLVLSW